MLKISAGLISTDIESSAKRIVSKKCEDEHLGPDVSMIELEA